MSQPTQKMDKYNRSVQHQWFHHATWGSPKYKNEGIGEVTWHSLTEDGKVEVCNIKFGDKHYKNVSVEHLNPVKMQEHAHKRSGNELDDKKKKKVKKEELNFKETYKRIGGKWNTTIKKWWTNGKIGDYQKIKLIWVQADIKVTSIV